MPMFTLAISCLTTSNFPWFMGLTFQVPMQHCSLKHWTFTTRHIHKWASFLVWFRLFIPSVASSLLFSNSILCTYWPGEFIFQCHIFVPFHTVHGVLKVIMLKWFAILFSSGRCLGLLLIISSKLLFKLKNSLLILNRSLWSGKWFVDFFPYYFCYFIRILIALIEAQQLLIFD